MAELALRIGSQRDCNLLLLERLCSRLPGRLQSLQARVRDVMMVSGLRTGCDTCASVGQQVLCIQVHMVRCPVC